MSSEEGRFCIGPFTWWVDADTRSYVRTMYREKRIFDDKSTTTARNELFRWMQARYYPVVIDTNKPMEEMELD